MHRGAGAAGFITKRQRPPYRKARQDFCRVATNLSNGEMVYSARAIPAWRFAPPLPCQCSSSPLQSTAKITSTAGWSHRSVQRSAQPGRGFRHRRRYLRPPPRQKHAGISDILWQTFSIFGQTINRHEQSSADITLDHHLRPPLRRRERPQQSRARGRKGGRGNLARAESQTGATE